jgi:hypothetical protein
MTASKPQRKSIDQSERVTWPFAHFIADHTTPIRHSEVSMASGVNGKPPVLVKLLPRGGRVPDHKPSCQAAALANANRHLRHAYLKLYGHEMYIRGVSVRIRIVKRDVFTLDAPGNTTAEVDFCAATDEIEFLHRDVANLACARVLGQFTPDLC